MKNKLIFALSLCISTQAIAAPQFVEVQKGSSNDISIAAGAPIREFDFAYISKGKTSAMVKATINAPKGTSITMKTVGVPAGMSASAAYAYVKSTYPVETAPYGGRFLKSHTIGSASSASKNVNNAGKFLCGGRLLASFKEYFSNIYKTAVGSNPTEDQLCAFLFSDYVPGGGSQNEMPTTSLNSISLNGRLLKDMCSKKAYDYLVVASVNLNKASASELTSGFTLSFTVDEEVSTRPAEWSIKPVSDGKFAPNPLLLIDTESGMADQALVAKFKSGNISTLQSVASLQTKKVAPWRKHALSSYLIGPYLRGGKASVYRSTNTSLKGVACMNMVRRRQSSSGYGR